MNESNASVDEKWIHSFAVTDCVLHPKKFTVYKITSVVFPIKIPEALTVLTVWKRFNDIKALLKFVKKRHKIEHLSGMVPTLRNHSFFKRFETDVITERKLFIIRLLDFIGQHPTLYKSQMFQNFLITSQILPLQQQENLEQIEADDLPPPPPNEENPFASTSSSLDESFESASSMSTPIIDSSSPAGNSDNEYKVSSFENDIIINGSKRIEMSSIDHSATIVLNRQYSSNIETPSQPNQREDLSKFKVLKIVNKIMHVQDLITKQTYMLKSIDKVFFNEISNFPFMVALVAYYVSDTNVYLLLEQATGGNLFEYIRSYNRHSAVANTSTKKSGRVFNVAKSLFSNSSSPIEVQDKSISQIEISHVKQNQMELDENNFSFYDLLHSYYDDIPISDDIKPIPVDNYVESFGDDAPHFNLLANDLDVNNILNCSQKLLKSVDTTLKRVQNTAQCHLSCNDYSIESIGNLNQSNKDKKDIYMDIIAPNYGELINTKDSIKNDNYSGKFKLFDISQLPRAIIKRWFREIIFAVKHLHANDVACYDLQPKNLLLGKNGEILLSYFYRREFTPYVFEDEMQQTTCYRTVYIAPERPLTLQSDVWSIGIIFYELLTGYSFQSCHPDGILSYFDIQYPENLELDTIVKDLIEGMLQIDPSQRKSLNEIEEHEFFTGN